LLAQIVPRLARAARKPPRVIVQRFRAELNARADRFLAPRRGKEFDDAALLERTGSSSVAALWSQLASRTFVVPTQSVTAAIYERACPGDAARIAAAADAALAHHVDLLGTGPIALGWPIDWHRDFKTGVAWPKKFMRDLDYMNLGCPSDVKVPWEVSRLQWLIPAGQAYMLSGDERYAVAVREVLEDWIAANPYAGSINWACTMEPALRILSWTWFFHVFARSKAWQDDAFRSGFLRTLFLHGEFTERYIELSDVNGNHLTADAAALVFAGLFFGGAKAAVRWAEQGWKLLNEELPRQVFPDGVDFEASIPYHRLVLELFFLAARYREAFALPVSHEYRNRIIDMARFTLAYSRRDGSTPLLGDADDARSLPFGGQSIGDHRYLLGVVGTAWQRPDLIAGFSGPRSEVFWTLGAHGAASLPDRSTGVAGSSSGFPHGGIYVMRNDRDHVLVDCGPVGLSGRGGHGHNDCLSFEAVLDGTHLVTDCGAYVYTASAEERNRFRSTGAHNTLQVDGEEINRFIGWNHLWTLRDDATPKVKQWLPGSECDRFVGAHSGYRRLSDEIRPIRTITLDHRCHALSVIDECEGTGTHTVSIPLHLASGVTARVNGPEEIVLTAGIREFLILWSSADEWKVEIGEGRMSPSYGLVTPIVRLLWHRCGRLPVRLALRLIPRHMATEAAAQGDDVANSIAAPA
jgi:uncharacterized heparinase superfamily protein